MHANKKLSADDRCDPIDGIYLSEGVEIDCIVFNTFFNIISDCYTMAVSELFHAFLDFLAHLSTTCSGGAIVTGHRPSSVRPSVCPSVRPSICPSVNNFFKNLLLQNQKANLDKTWQECSLGEALQKLLKEFNSNKNSGCHGNKMAENGKNL